MDRRKRINLLRGDCLKLMKEIPDNSIDMVLTDIPYGEVNRKSNGMRNLNKGKADIVNFKIDELLNEVIRVTKGSIYIFFGSGQISEIDIKFRDTPKMSRRLIIWEKKNPSPLNCKRLWVSGIEQCVFGRFPLATYNGGYENTVLRYPTGRSKLHPTQKPIRLFEHLIIKSSKVGDTVLDMFMGSGTTGVACKNLKRKFIGIELDRKYFNIAKKRMNEL